MRKRKLGILSAAMAMGMAAMIGGSQATQVSRVNQVSETKATAPEQRRSRSSIVNHVGGIPIVTTGGAYGMSPKEYGMRFAHGPGKRHVNKLRLKHNAKLKRRNGR